MKPGQSVECNLPTNNCTNQNEKLFHAHELEVSFVGLLRALLRLSSYQSKEELEQGRTKEDEWGKMNGNCKCLIMAAVKKWNYYKLMKSLKFYGQSREGFVYE